MTESADVPVIVPPHANATSARRRVALRGTAMAMAMAMVLALAVGGCASPPPAPAPPPPPPVDATLQGAVNGALLALQRQLGPIAAGTTAVVDPLLEARTGQQTRATEAATRVLGASLPAVLQGLQLLPFSQGGASGSRWLVNGTLAGAAASAGEGRYTLTLAVADRASGTVLARATSPVVDPQLDRSPTRFYADSPAMARDRAVQGYLDTTERPVGQAADPVYLAQIPTAALLAQAQEAYDGEQWSRAHELMTAAAGRTDGQQLRTYNGLYLANLKLGRAADAEAAFGKIAEIGLASQNLAVKILFKPGGTEFLDEPATYGMWLRQIARATQASSLCLMVVGHTSKTGSEAVNRSLSLRRAQAMRERLVREAAPLGRSARVRTEGRGFDETIVGTGTDDLRDALDRRVEFKVVDCA